MTALQPPSAPPPPRLRPASLAFCTPACHPSLLLPAKAPTSSCSHQPASAPGNVHAGSIAGLQGVKRAVSALAGAGATGGTHCAGLACAPCRPTARTTRLNDVAALGNGDLLPVHGHLRAPTAPIPCWGACPRRTLPHRAPTRAPPTSMVSTAGAGAGSAALAKHLAAVARAGSARSCRARRALRRSMVIATTGDGARGRGTTGVRHGRERGGVKLGGSERVIQGTRPQVLDQAIAGQHPELGRHGACAPHSCPPPPLRGKTRSPPCHTANACMWA